MNVMRSWRFIRVILHTFATMRQHCFSTVLAVLDDADDSDRDFFSYWDLDLFSAMCNAVFKSSSDFLCFKSKSIVARITAFD